MKITDLQLEQYGIYHNASWQPSQTALNVVMGENESGKTTMLRFIRDMLFGYGRGKWQGRRGSMGFIRADGNSYRVYRNEKEKWFEDGNHVKHAEELPAIWWHGLNRYMYEQIFAMGLEDLQGTAFLADDTVRSRFFMLQGGDQLSDVKKQIQDSKAGLLAGSSQGKRKINQLLSDLNEINRNLDELSNQEKEFSDLQKKQDELKKQTAILADKLEKDKDEDRQLEKRLGAWDYYRKAAEVKRQMELSEQVTMFPSNGKEQWNKLMNRMKVLHDQKTVLQEKLDEYSPVKKEDIIPWASMAGELDKLYVDLGQWRQTEKDAEALEQEKESWRIHFINLGYKLSLWDQPLNLDDACVNVDWEEGRRLSRSLGVRVNELHFWKRREPEVETLNEDPEENEDVRTEEEWQKVETMAADLERLLHHEADIHVELERLNGEEEKRLTPWLMFSLLFILGAAGGFGSFYMATAGYAAIYAGLASLALGVFFYVLHDRAVHKKGKTVAALEKELDEVIRQKQNISTHFPGKIPETTEDLQAFHNLMQERRADFYKNQAKKQAASWKMETIRKQEQEHQKWVEEGKTLTEKKEQAEKDWNSWLKRNKLPITGSENLSALQEQWQKIYSEEGRGKILDVRLEQIDAKLDAFSRRAASIISSTGLNCPVNPDSIAFIYEETHKKSLEWEALQEKNRQHEAYEKEMAKLDDSWTSCKREMDALLNLVNAKNAEEFAAKVNAHEHRDQINREWERIRQDLRMFAGGEEEFKALWKSLETGQYEDWMNSHKNLSKAIEEESIRLGELQKSQGAVENEIFRLAGDNSITDTLQRKERIEAEIRENLKDWLTLTFAEEILDQAQTLYESGKQPQIVRQANEFLQEMTRGKYSLLLSDGGKSIVIEDRMHRQRDAKVWSSGTGDQVYLSIRLAMALSFGNQLEPLPIVLDDIFVRFDEERQRETLRFLMDLGRTQQIFLFTCHERTMHIAEEVGYEKGTGAFIRLHSGQIEQAGY